MSACGGGSPTQPTQQPPPTPALFQGPALLSIMSFDSSCSEKTPAWGFSPPRVFTSVTVTVEGGTYVARSDDPRYGDIELRVTPGATFPADGAVNGNLRGRAVDLLSILQFPNPAQVRTAAGQDVAVTGVFLNTTLGLSGTATGPIVYTDNQRGVMTCTSASWLMFGRPPVITQAMLPGTVWVRSPS